MSSIRGYLEGQSDGQYLSTERWAGRGDDLRHHRRQDDHILLTAWREQQAQGERRYLLDRPHWSLRHAHVHRAALLPITLDYA